MSIPLERESEPVVPARFPTNSGYPNDTWLYVEMVSVPVTVRTSPPLVNVGINSISSPGVIVTFSSGCAKNCVYVTLLVTPAPKSGGAVKLPLPRAMVCVVATAEFPSVRLPRGSTVPITRETVPGSVNTLVINTPAGFANRTVPAMPPFTSTPVLPKSVEAPPVNHVTGEPTLKFIEPALLSDPPTNVVFPIVVNAL